MVIFHSVGQSRHFQELSGYYITLELHSRMIKYPLRVFPHLLLYFTESGICSLIFLSLVSPSNCLFNEFPAKLRNSLSVWKVYNCITWISQLILVHRQFIKLSKKIKDNFIIRTSRSIFKKMDRLVCIYFFIRMPHSTLIWLF